MAKNQKKVRVAIVGVGNCANSLIQGVHYYRNAADDAEIPGYGAEPDILFIAKAHEDRLRKTFLDGPADLVVEVISPDSMERDRIKKYNDYEAAGIPEYWLIDPERESAEFYRLAGGRYEQIATPQGIYRSGILPGLELPLAWLSPGQQPTLVESMRRMGIL